MSKETITVIMSNGIPTEIPAANLDNFKRLNGANIREVILENQTYDEILEEIEDEESVVEEITDSNLSDRDVRMNELMNSDKDVVRKLADEIAVKKEMKKVGHTAKQETLAKFILDNQ